MAPVDIQSQDILVQLLVVNIWLLLLFGLYGLAHLVEWAGRTFWGVDWEALWKRYGHLLGD